MENFNSYVSLPQGMSQICDRFLCSSAQASNRSCGAGDGPSIGAGMEVFPIVRAWQQTNRSGNISEMMTDNGWVRGKGPIIIASLHGSHFVCTVFLVLLTKWCCSIQVHPRLGTVEVRPLIGGNRASWRGASIRRSWTHPHHFLRLQFAKHRLGWPRPKDTWWHMMTHDDTWWHMVKVWKYRLFSKLGNFFGSMLKPRCD